LLRAVLVYQQALRLFFAQFGKILDEETLGVILKKIQREAFEKGRADEIGSYDFYKYRVLYATYPAKDILFIFVTDLTDEEEELKRQIQLCKEEFISTFKEILDQEFDPSAFDVFHSTVEKMLRVLLPKISLVGFSGVGKTAITQLLQAEQVATDHVPTITGRIGTIAIGDLTFFVWDFAGQETYSFIWNRFIENSDVVLIITDSTAENVAQSKYFIDLVKSEVPHARMAVICNKQDLPGALSPPEIERMLGNIRAYSMVATDPANRQKMVTIIADVLEISPSVSPLFNPLTMRDQQIAAAEDAVKSGNLPEAYRLYVELESLSMEIGDDSSANQFQDMADDIKKKLEAGGQEVTSSPTVTQITSLESVPENQRKHFLTLIKRLKNHSAELTRFLTDLVPDVMGDLSIEESSKIRNQITKMKTLIEQRITYYEELLKKLD